MRRADVRCTRRDPEWRGGMRAYLAHGALIVGLLLTACGPGYIRGTKIEATPEKQELANLVERYRVAVEQRDMDALQQLAATEYYENGSTTEDPADDYDYNGLVKLLHDLKDRLKAVKYQIDIEDIQVLGETAQVDYQYRSQFLYTTGDQDHWETANDRNRLTFKKESGQWRIVSGM
jgi:hypothetical protein